jgi:hypothetical protein
MLSILFHQAIDGEEVSDANIAASLTGSDTPGSEVTISYKRRGSVPKDLVLTRMPAGTFSDRKKQRASDDIDELLEVLGWGLGRTQTRTCMLTQTRMHTHSHARTPSGVLLAALSPTRAWASTMHRAALLLARKMLMRSQIS